LSWIHRKAGRKPEALALDLRALRDLEPLVRAHRANPGLREQLARALASAFLSQPDQGAQREAWPRLERALALNEALVRENPFRVSSGMAVADALLIAAFFQAHEGDTTGASDRMTRAEEFIRRLPRSQSRNLWYDLARARVSLGAAIGQPEPHADLAMTALANA